MKQGIRKGLCKDSKSTANLPGYKVFFNKYSHARIDADRRYLCMTEEFYAVCGTQNWGQVLARLLE